MFCQFYKKLIFLKILNKDVYYFKEDLPVNLCFDLAHNCKWLYSISLCKENHDPFREKGDT